MAQTRAGWQAYMDLKERFKNNDPTLTKAERKFCEWDNHVSEPTEALRKLFRDSHEFFSRTGAGK